MKRKIFIHSLVVLLVGLLSLTGCDTSKGGDRASLHQYKTSYVGNNSKVIAIASLQEYPKGLGFAGIEILSQEEPYGLRVKLEGGAVPSREDLWKKAVITLSLIDNISDLYYID